MKMKNETEKLNKLWTNMRWRFQKWNRNFYATIKYADSCIRKKTFRSAKCVYYTNFLIELHKLKISGEVWGWSSESKQKVSVIKIIEACNIELLGNESRLSNKTMRLKFGACFWVWCNSLTPVVTYLSNVEIWVKISVRFLKISVFAFSKMLCKI